ncbi:phage tail protein [Escherichia coli]|jgi:hypothetical protein|uniref:Phage tail protein n=2 Tax=Escherichia coli TaxID=562 RepID=A0A5P0JAN1_ECOLX|nr:MULTISPECIES: hypothetical protein [Enterobacteriaceae]EFA8745473.1 phage tail protein [Escherichia coli O117]EFB4389366.1 phage tail protein [Escherichia coli]EFL8226679.1 phage tail protein [Escherichia coli]EFN9862912.1 phage tail protein [Escherichia coli]EFO1636365.1 phage tail protein [Escherichia coli]
MELNSFHRLYDWITWITSSISVGVGVMTWNEKLGMAGLMLGVLSGWRAWVHRARVERAQEKRNALIEQILTLAARRDLTAVERQELTQLKAGIDDEGGY